MHPLDWALCIGAVAFLFGQGWWLARAQKTNEDYFVGGRQMGWLAVGLSLFATVFSPVSFVGLPRTAAYEDYHLFLAILFIPLTAPLAGRYFVPLFQRLRLTSAYEYLERRFNVHVRRGASLLFGLYSLGWMGSMLYATGLSVQAALELDELGLQLTMVLLGALTTVYTTLGGFKAAVWTNVAKAIILAGVIIAVLTLALARVEGGLASVLQLGWEHNKFAMFKMELDFTTTGNFFAACAFGIFVYFGTLTTAQPAVQRYVSMPTAAAARHSLMVHGIGTACVCLLFFLLGTTLFAFYYQQNPPLPGAPLNSVFPGQKDPSQQDAKKKQDHLTINFMRAELGYPGLLGLLLAGLLVTVMGSTSSALNGLSSLVVSDWLAGRNVGVRTSRLLSLLFGVAAVAAALLVPLLGDNVFAIIMKISGMFFGMLLGLFVLAAFVPRANAPGAMLGLLAGLISLALIFPTNLSQWWYGAFTCVPTLVVGVLSSLLFPPPPEEKVRGLLATRSDAALL